MSSPGFFQVFFMCGSQGPTAVAVEMRETEVSARGLARLGMVVVGMGIAAAVAPGSALADGLDFQISIDGYDLFPTEGNTATATSGMGDIAIAFGNGASATAQTGLGNFSFADGTNAIALSGGGDYDTAIDIGNNNLTGDQPQFALAGAGSHDFAFIDADNSEATASGDIIQSGYDSSNNTAIIFDPFGVGNDVVNSGVNGFHAGNYDFGAILFDDNIINQGASGADYLYDIVTTLGTETNAAAATAADWWAELMALF